MANSHRILSLLLACIACYHSALSENQLSSFEKVTGEPAFIDKTNLIKTFISTAHQTNCYYALITCPSRFGKSSNLDMIKRFIEYSDDENVKTQNRNLFKNPNLNLHVANEAEFFSQYFAKYSLLFLNFSVEGNKTTHEEVFGVVKDQIKQLFAQYSWLYKYVEPANPPSDKTKRNYPSAENKELFEKIQSDKLSYSDYEKSLMILADDLSNYLNGDRGIVLLIDDYDAPIRFAMENQANGSTIIPIIQALLTNALPKDNIVINFAMVVGTLVFDGFNDTIRNFNFLEEHKFFDYFGFTLKDMQVLSQADRFGFEEKENYKIQQYYNGYQTKSNKARLFNPASVAAYYRERKFENFLPKTGYTINLVERLRSKYLRNKIQNLILNRISPFKHEKALKPSHIDTLEEILAKNDTRSAFKSNQVALYLSVLFQQGYLFYMDGARPQKFSSRLRLPNEEVRLQLAEDLYKYFQKVVQGYQEKAKNVFTFFKKIMDGTFIEGELIEGTITALHDVMNPLYALGKRDYKQFTLDFLTFIYTSLVFGGKPEEKFDSIEIAVVVDRVINGELSKDSGEIDFAVWDKKETVLLYVEMRTYSEFKTLQDALNHSESFRPSGQLTKTPNYVKPMIIYLNINEQVEIEFGPNMVYYDGKWIPIRNIPSDSTTWEELRQGNYLYADKTKYLKRLLMEDGNMFYLTRPRRFGKSSFLDMTRCFFNGNYTLFRGLDIASKGNIHFFRTREVPQHLTNQKWAECPVIHLDFSRIEHHNTIYSFRQGLARKLKFILKSYKLEYDSKDGIDIDDVISLLRSTFQLRVVVLIDEYDSPFQNALLKEETLAFAEELRTYIKYLLNALKGSGGNLRLVLVMGVSRVSMPTSQSDPNNFVDLTYEENFAGAFGFTSEEMKLFHPEIGFQFNLQGETEIVEFTRRLKESYDGYNFTYQYKHEIQNVLNPVSTMQSLKKKKIACYWSNTVNVDHVIRRLYFWETTWLTFFQHRNISRELITTVFNPLKTVVEPEVLMLHYGYSTLERYDNETDTVLINFPNEEIITGLKKLIHEYGLRLHEDTYLTRHRRLQYELEYRLKTGNLNESMNVLTKLFSTSFSRVVEENTNEFGMVQRIVDKLQLGEIHYKESVRFMKPENPKQLAGDIDLLILTRHCHKNFIMSLKCGHASANDAIQQLIGYLKNYPTTFLKAVQNPTDAWFVGINFGEPKKRSSKLNEWVGIPFNGTALCYEECIATPQKLCDRLIKMNNVTW